jgi:hypothetical protein
MTSGRCAAVPEIGLIKDRLATNHCEQFCRFRPSGLGKRQFQITKIGLHTAGLQAHPATVHFNHITVRRFEQLVQVKQALPQTCTGLCLKPAGPQ